MKGNPSSESKVHKKSSENGQVQVVECLYSSLQR